MEQLVAYTRFSCVYLVLLSCFLYDISFGSFVVYTCFLTLTRNMEMFNYRKTSKMEDVQKNGNEKDEH